MQTQIFVVMLQVQDKAPGEWRNLEVHTRKDRAGIEQIVKMESRDLSLGGLIETSKAKRRIWVRTVQVTGEEFIKLP